MSPALLLIVAAVVFRIVTGFFGHSDSIGWMNFAPIAAIALCAAAYFPRKYKFTVPMIALLISDLVLNAHYGFSLVSPFVLSHYVGFAIIGCLGLLLQRRASWKTLLPASASANVRESIPPLEEPLCSSISRTSLKSGSRSPVKVGRANPPL